MAIIFYTSIFDSICSVLFSFLEDKYFLIVNFSKYLDKGGILEQVKDIGFFRSFSINGNLGTLTWNRKVDIAPETLYAEATGSGLPDRVEPSDNGKRRQNR